jgi:hypothetical protein
MSRDFQCHGGAPGSRTQEITLKIKEFVSSGMTVTGAALVLVMKYQNSARTTSGDGISQVRSAAARANQSPHWRSSDPQYRKD